MPQRLGGSFLVAGSLGFGVLVLYGLTGAAVGVGAANSDMPGWISFGAMTLLGVGAAILVLCRPAVDAVRTTRLGLALIAISLLVLTTLDAWFANNPVPGDPLESPVILVYVVYVGCYVAALLGQILVGLALLADRGAGRAVGALFIGGLVAILLSWVLTDLKVVQEIAALAGLAAIVGGWAGLGLLVLRRASVQSPPAEATT